MDRNFNKARLNTQDMKYNHRYKLLTERASKENLSIRMLDYGCNKNTPLSINVKKRKLFADVYGQKLCLVGNIQFTKIKDNKYAD